MERIVCAAFILVGLLLAGCESQKQDEKSANAAAAQAVVETAAAIEASAPPEPGYFLLVQATVPALITP